MDFSIAVDDAAFAFLRVQKGNLDNLARDRARWHAEYERDLERQFRSFEAHLPEKVGRILDVGSGLGGIDILIRRHYATRGLFPEVCLLDGEHDSPRVHLHRETFNDMTVARNFHKSNGGRDSRFRYWTPRTIWPGPDGPMDLIVSFGSWCFHFPPSTYLPALCHSGIHAGTVLVLDVRKHKANWWRELTAVLDPWEILAEKEKWTRWAFKVKAK